MIGTMAAPSTCLAGGVGNQLRTGNLLFEMSLFGDTLAAQRAPDPIAYIERHWNDNNPDPGWRPHDEQAMYCLMKGLASLDLDTLTVWGDPVDWYTEFAQALIAAQQPDGNWSADNWGDRDSLHGLGAAGDREVGPAAADQGRGRRYRRLRVRPGRVFRQGHVHRRAVPRRWDAGTLRGRHVDPHRDVDRVHRHRQAPLRGGARHPWGPRVESRAGRRRRWGAASWRTPRRGQGERM